MDLILGIIRFEYPLLGGRHRSSKVHTKSLQQHALDRNEVLVSPLITEPFQPKRQTSVCLFGSSSFLMKGYFKKSVMA
jgi:hypothetical protein